MTSLSNSERRYAAIRVLRWAGYDVRRNGTQVRVNGHPMPTWALLARAEELTRKRLS